jgi:MinD-like ATPase involved in chromosome partitioning or flagellar assembly
MVDAGTGMTPWAERLWRHAQQTMLVCTSQPHSVTQAYAAVKLAYSPALQDKVRLTINRCDDEAKAALVAERFAETCRQFLSLSVNQFAWMPIDKSEVGRQHGKTEPDQRYQRCLRLLAADAAADVRASAMRLISREPRAPRTIEAAPQHARRMDESARATEQSYSSAPCQTEFQENGVLEGTQLK